MVENRVFRGAFVPKMDEIFGEWRILHNGELVYMAFLLLVSYVT
jgi:hypothetical protein